MKIKLCIFCLLSFVIFGCAKEVAVSNNSHNEVLI